MSTFYRPVNNGNNGQKFNGWTKGVNEASIVGVSMIEGDRLQKVLDRKSNARGYKVNKLDINLVIEIGKKDYEYTKKLEYLFAFDRDENGVITTQKSKDGANDIRFAYNLFDMLLSKPQLGLNEKGIVITEQGKEISSLVSYLKTAVNKDKYNYFAWMEKDASGKYWNCKCIARTDVELSVNLFENYTDYLKSKWAKEPAKDDTPDWVNDNSSFPPAPDDDIVFE